jgi:ribosomal-protein-alanine N-acetyltransferase
VIAATPLHAGVLAAIHEAAFPPGERWNAPAFATLLQTPGASALLDERGGFVLTRHAGGEAELLTIAVEPGLRRQGVGRSLLAAALAACEGPMFLEVASDNAAAVALYRSLGFVGCGHRRDYYGPSRDALILRHDPGHARP